MGTLGGNLMQQTRCWYYRGPVKCWLKGGDECYARHGENELHSIFMTSTSPCVSAHPSDPAAALLALGATVHYETTDGSAQIPIDDLYRLPDPGNRTFCAIPPGAVITGVTVPPAAPGSKSLYNKQMARATWGFALAGLGISIAPGRDGKPRDARVALTGVAPIPFRVLAAESYLERVEPGEVDAGEWGSLLVADARPLSENRYKVRLLRGMVVEALRDLGESA
jgi:xanthine dehydrogenase YagS FAD-binding subunit